MTTVAGEMRNAIVALAGERGWGETRERWLERAAIKAGVSYRTAKSIFYRELRDPKASIVTLVRHAVERKSAIQEESARTEFAQLDARMRVLEARLNAIDPNYDSAALDGFSARANGTGRKSGAVDKE